MRRLHGHVALAISQCTAHRRVRHRVWGSPIGPRRRLTLRGAGGVMSLLVCWLAFAAPASATEALAFGAPVTVSSPGQFAFGPQVAYDDAGNALAVFVGNDGSNYLVQSAFRPAGGAFASPVDLSNTGENAIEPQLAFDRAGNALAVWTRVNGKNGTVQAAFRPAAGAFAALPDLSVASEYTGSAQVAFDSGGDALAVWNHCDCSNYVEQSAYRPAGGVAPFGGFEAAVNSSPSGTDVSEAQLAVDGAGNALAVWVRFDGTNAVVASSFRPAGGVFAPSVDLSAPERNAHAPQVTFDSAGNALAVWTRANHGGAQDSVQAAFRPAGGAFAAPVDVSADGSLLVATPQASFDAAGNALAVWTRADVDTVFAQAAFRPAGGNFAAPVNLSNAGNATNNQGAFVPQVAFDRAGDALAVWRRYLAGANDSAQVAFRPAGGAFGAPVDLSAAETTVENPQVALDGSGNALVVWSGDNVVQAAFGSPVSSGGGIPPPNPIPVSVGGGSGSGGGGGSGGASTGVAPAGAGPGFATSGPVKIVRGGTIVITVKTSGPGSISAVATTAKSAALSAATKTTQRVRYGTGSAKASAAQKVTVRIKPGAAARKLLGRGRRLRVAIKLTFIPRGGGSPATTSAHASVKLAKSKK